MVVFTEKFAVHINKAIEGLLNTTFNNAVELVVAAQALFKSNVQVFQPSLIGGIFSNILLVLGMCLFYGRLKFFKQEFIA